MMQDRAILTLGSWRFSTGWSFGVACALSAACAGGDTPPTDDVEDLLATAYGGRQPTAQAGSTGMGNGGSSSGTGGSTSQGTSGAGGSTSGGGTGGSASGGSAGTGAVSTGGTAGTGSGGGDCDAFAILQASCNGGSCHGDGSSFTNFAANEAEAESFAGQQSAFCGTQDNAPIFNPDNPSTSLVIKKITNTSTCGGRMPAGATTQVITPDEVACLEEWIGTL
jgi:hypothetical protein